MRSVNLHSAAPGEARSLDLGELLGSEQVAVRLWELAAGEPIGEYHLHHGIEEWLLVVSGNAARAYARGASGRCGSATPCASRPGRRARTS